METTDNSQLRVYIAGPMTGLPLFNKPAFNKAAQQLRHAGFSVISPAELYPHTDRSWEYYMKAGLAALLQCDAILMLDGWESSRGAKLEFKVASALKLQVLYQADIKL